MLIPFIIISMGLFKYNKFPSQVFVGDTYCYYSGMVLVTVGILGKINFK
jgi:UDP-N-acetylglucosamine--dolichyl-phosphate N-acetylglucosaminephosphotransferase